jgi:arginase family enzyme
VTGDAGATTTTTTTTTATTITHTHTYTHTHTLTHSLTHTDGVDPAIAPSTGTAVRGGLTFREAHYLVEAISESGNLGSLDMVFS